jgi:hypothetical protein
MRTSRTRPRLSRQVAAEGGANDLELVTRDASLLGREHERLNHERSAGLLDVDHPLGEPDPLHVDGERAKLLPQVRFEPDPHVGDRAERPHGLHLGRVEPVGLVGGVLELVGDPVDEPLESVERRHARRRELIRVPPGLGSGGVEKSGLSASGHGQGR